MSTPEDPYSPGVDSDAPGQPINWAYRNIVNFINNNYWHKPEDAIGDIRLFLNRFPQEQSAIDRPNYLGLVNDRDLLNEVKLRGLHRPLADTGVVPVPDWDCDIIKLYIEVPTSRLQERFQQTLAVSANDPLCKVQSFSTRSGMIHIKIGE